MINSLWLCRRQLTKISQKSVFLLIFFLTYSCKVFIELVIHLERVQPKPVKSIRPCTKLHNPRRCSIINNFGNGSPSHSFILSYCSGYPCLPWNIQSSGRMAGTYFGFFCIIRVRILRIFHFFIIPKKSLSDRFS